VQGFSVLGIISLLILAKFGISIHAELFQPSNDNGTAAGYYGGWQAGNIAQASR
jgi:hypothetical protein